MYHLLITLSSSQIMSTHIDGKNQNYRDEVSSVLMPAEKQQDFDWQHIDLKKRGKIGGGGGVQDLVVLQKDSTGLRRRNIHVYCSSKGLKGIGKLCSPLCWITKC